MDSFAFVNSLVDRRGEDVEVIPFIVIVVVDVALELNLWEWLELLNVCRIVEVGQV